MELSFSRDNTNSYGSVKGHGMGSLLAFPCVTSAKIIADGSLILEIRLPAKLRELLLLLERVIFLQNGYNTLTSEKYCSPLTMTILPNNQVESPSPLVLMECSES
jgi:hypothetical protein